MPCAYGPFGDMWGSGSLGVLTVATLLRTASSPHCPLTWVQFLIVWGRAPPPPPYFLTVPGLGFPTTSSVEQSRLLLGPGLPEVYPPGSQKSPSLHIAGHFQREAGGMVMQRGQVGEISDPPGSPDHTGPGVLLHLAPGPSLLCLSHI